MSHRALLHFTAAMACLAGADVGLWSWLLGGRVVDILIGLLGICQLLTGVFAVLDQARGVRR